MLDIAAVSKNGDRDYNEDSIGYFQDKDNCVLVLADGLGGHGHGEIASSLCVKTSIDKFKEKESKSDEEFFSDCFETAQNVLIEEQKRKNELSKMKSTLVVCYISKDKCSWGHIGDSRLYFFRKGKIISQTLDHSVPQMLVNIGDIKPSEIRHHEDRNRLLRAMGVETDKLKYEVDCVGMELQSGDTVLLCSDGFWEWITERKMCRYISSKKSAELIMEKMTDYVLKKGKGKNMDNYSAVLAKIL